MGPSPSGLNGFKTERGARLAAQHGDRLEILYGKHPYKIEFNPPPKTSTDSEKIKKRLVSEVSDEDDRALSSKRSKLMADSESQVDTQESKNVEKTAETTAGILDVAGPSNSSNYNGKNSTVTETGTWEHYSNKTLYVYTSKGCEGRSKVRLHLY